MDITRIKIVCGFCVLAILIQTGGCRTTPFQRQPAVSDPFVQGPQLIPAMPTGSAMPPAGQTQYVPGSTVGPFTNTGASGTSPEIPQSSAGTAPNFYNNGPPEVGIPFETPSTPPVVQDYGGSNASSSATAIIDAGQ